MKDRIIIVLAWAIVVVMIWGAGKYMASQGETFTVTIGATPTPQAAR